jgi:hypothetical protein
MAKKPHESALRYDYPGQRQLNHAGETEDGGDSAQDLSAEPFPVNPMVWITTELQSTESLESLKNARDVLFAAFNESVIFPAEKPFHSQLTDVRHDMR